MIAFNDHLGTTLHGTQTNANSVTTFLALDQGYICQFLAGKPYFYYEPSLPKARNYVDPATLTLPPPKVNILYARRKLFPAIKEPVTI